MSRAALTTTLALALAAPATAQATRLPSVPAQPSACAPRPVPDVTPSASIDLSGEISCGAQQGWPWSAAYSRNGAALYVSMFGGLNGSGGCEVVRLDSASGQVVARIPVGEGPEEIALLEGPSLAAFRGFVTCSAGSSVVVFDGFDQVLATVPLPPDPQSGWSTAFPFGALVDASRNTLWVGTNDSSGRVFAIDLASLTLDPARTIQLGASRSVARMELSSGELLLAVSRPHAGWTGSIAELGFVTPGQPGSHAFLELANANNTGEYPSAQDVEVTCDGRAFVVGFDMGTFVHVVDVSARARTGLYPTNTSGVQGKYQGLAMSREGLLVVSDLWTSELARLDAWSGAWLGTTEAVNLVGFHSGPGEALFRPDGRELVVVFGASDSLALLSVQ